MDCSPPGSSVHKILQARILDWVAISFSMGSSQARNQTRVSCIAGRFFTSWATRQACNAGDPGLIPGSGKAPGEGNDNPLQCSCLQNPMDRGAWQATVHRILRVTLGLATKPPPPGAKYLRLFSLNILLSPSWNRVLSKWDSCGYIEHITRLTQRSYRS